MNNLQRIISLENRVKELESKFDAYMTPVEVKTETNPEPKFKAWEAYKSSGSSIVICTKDHNELLYGYGVNCIGEFIEDDKVPWGKEYQKATPEETESMLKKACEIWGGEDWENVKIKKPISGLNGDCYNQDDCKVDIDTVEIWNNNGCIMHKGKWAEKLEEQTELKHGEKYICWNNDRDFTIAEYLAETKHMRASSEEIYLLDDWDKIEPYTPERLIELAEKF